MNRERWLLAASILMLAGAAAYHLRPSEGIRSARPVAPTERPVKPLPVEKSPANGPARVGLQSETAAEPAVWGRNPFLTEREATEGKGWRPDEGVEVKAIIVGQPRSVATLNGRSVVVGEKVGEETIREIRPDAVVLEKEGRQRVIRIRQSSIAIEVKEGRQ